MSMFAPYSPALPSPASAAPIAGNRPTMQTVNQNVTAGLGNGGSGTIVTTAVVAILLAIGVIVAGRFLLNDVRVA